MLARCSSAVLQGLDALAVTIEVDLAPGLPGLTIVGLPDAAVHEARERVRSALRNSGFRVPLTRVVVNLAPADLRKAGPGFDLPIALGLLVASGQLDPALLAGVWSAGELGLDGRLQPIRGALALAMAARLLGARALLVPEAVAAEAAVVEGLPIWSAERLEQLVNRLRGQASWPAPKAGVAGSAPSEKQAWDRASEELAAVRGQLLGRRALEVAAAGGHHLLLVGPPGGGKTMLARCLPGLLPALAREEALELTQLHSVAGLLRSGDGLIQRRPFRAPHHGCSAAALVGGGALPRPGELSLAHQGVLFLDELTEFRREVLEQLRQPLEEGEIWLSRNRLRCRYPCRTTLVAATNPCPCGWYGDPQRTCRCGHRQRLRYWGRLSGPLLDRIDLQVMVRRLDPGELEATYAGRDQPESTAVVAARVAAARARMRQRNPGACSNSHLTVSDLRQLPCWSEAGLALWRQAGKQRHWSARVSERLLRVALTLADLAGTDQVGPAQIAEAMNFRCFEGCLEEGLSVGTEGDADSSIPRGLSGVP